MSENYSTRQDTASRTLQVDWWAEDDARTSGMMLSQIVRQIRQRHSWRYDADVLHAGLYAGNANCGGVIMTPGGDFQYSPSTKPRNVVRMAVDTHVAKVTKHRPMPQCQTSKGNWREQKRARKMSQMLEGAFYHGKFYERAAPMAVRDSGIFSRAIVKVCRRGRKRIAYERVFPWEFLVDEWDGRYGEPRNFYQIYTLDLGRALALFGKKREKESDEDHHERVEAIRRAATSTPTDEWTWEGEADTTVTRVRFVEAYHLCDDIDAHDDDEKHECTGCKDIAILGGIRIDRSPFEWGESPYEILTYCEPLAGSIGMGLAEMLEGWQETIDTRHDIVEEACRAVGGAIFIADNNCDIPDAKFQNGGVVILKKRPGSAVQAITPAPVNPMIFQSEQDGPQQALAEFGFSQSTTSGTKQPGIISGIAINAMDDIEDERHLPQGRQYETFNLGIARKTLLVAKDIAEAEGEFEVDVPMKGGLLPLKWSDVNLDKFQVRVFSTSILPQQLGARLEMLKMLFDAQLIDRATFLQQLGGPDVGWELDLETSDRLNIDEKLEAICDAEESDELEFASQQAVPSNYQNPQWAQKRAQQRYNKGQVEGMPAENLRALQQFMAQCQTVIDRQQPPPVPTQPGIPSGPAGLTPDMGAMGGMPPGAPMMPPPGAPAPMPQAQGMM